MGLLEFKLVKEFLERNEIHYKVTQHRPVYTSEEAAKIRGVELKTGVKALVLKTETGYFILGLVAADRKVDLKRLAKVARAKKLQLATPGEVLKLTGCEVGSVHPFGNLYGLPTFLDKSVLENDSVNFNAGLHIASIQMNARDLVKAIKPVISDFSKNEQTINLFLL
jgi:Ala-tRNA(Pro) deacylase